MQTVRWRSVFAYSFDNLAYLYLISFIYSSFDFCPENIVIPGIFGPIVPKHRPCFLLSITYANCWPYAGSGIIRFGLDTFTSALVYINLSY